MTNEEAIKLVDDRMCYGRGKWSKHHQPVIDEYWQAGEMAIKALEAEPHWIPVTERLPEDEQDVLITYYDDITMGWYRKSDNTWLIYEGEANAEPDEVTAWMPLPEPYKGVTDGKV